MTTFAETVARKVTHLTEREQRALLKITGEHREGFRDHVLFAMALGTGLREHELLALNVGDVLTDKGKARRRIILRVFKSRKREGAPPPAPQEVILSDTLRAKIERLVKLNRERGLLVHDEAPLFVSREGGRLSERQARTAFTRWQERAGFERHVHFHALRHTACTSIYAATKDIRLTQKFARHARITTTTIYTHPSDDDMLRAVEALRC